MNLVDSDGWFEYLTDGPNADFFAEPVEDTANLLVPSTCLLEIFARVSRRWGEGEALQAVAAMGQGRILDLGTHLAIEAAQVSAEENLPLSSSVMLAAARSQGALLWSQDSVFEGRRGLKYTKKLEPRRTVEDSGDPDSSRMVRRVLRVDIDEQPSDAAYWRARPASERMEALEEIRKEYHQWRYDAEPRLQRVHRVAER